MSGVGPREPAEDSSGGLGEAEARRRAGGLSAAAGEEFSMREAIGGPRGFAEAIAPSVVFLVVYTLGNELRPAIIWALGVAGVLLLARLATRSSPAQAISGFVGVAICAWFANRSGEARDYFVPGFWINAAYATVYLLSLARFPALTAGGRVHRPGPWPIMGLFLSALLGEGLAWRDDDRRRALYVKITLMWVVFFLLRLAVQLPLYLADQVQALGMARLFMGTPMFALVAWFTWLMLRSVPKAGEQPEPAGPPGG